MLSIAIKHQLASNDFDMHLNHSHKPDAIEQIFWRSFTSKSSIEYFHTHSNSKNSTRSSPIPNAYGAKLLQPIGISEQINNYLFIFNLR